jgi:hypothetical protein
MNSQKLVLSKNDKLIVKNQCSKCKLWSNYTGCQWGLDNGVNIRPVNDCYEFLSQKETIK